MAAGAPELVALLWRINPDAGQAERHLWLTEVLQWIRGDQCNVQDAVRRVRQIVAMLGEQDEWMPLWQRWWQAFISNIDATPLLADYGFAPRTAFASELGHRLLRKWLPATPETGDLSELFHLLFPHAYDAQWIRAIDPATMAQLDAMLFLQAETGTDAGAAALQPAEAEHPVLTLTSNAWSQPAPGYWRKALTEAVVVCVSQIGATGFASEIRTRMQHDAATQSAFHDLHFRLDAWLNKLTVQGLTHADTVAESELLRAQLVRCRQAAATVYPHLAEQGISVGIVFRLRQLRDRIQRVNELLDCLYSKQPAHATARLVARLVMVGQERRSVRSLISHSTHLTAAKVAERHAETGEHYITRDAREWRHMFASAAGGGCAMGFAVWFKFLIAAMGLSIFWNGLWAGVNYATIFVIVQLLHWTIATKQPAVTAPAMAAKLKAMDQPNAVDTFVDEVVHLIRSQVVAIVGNLLTVGPMAYLLSVLLQYALGQPMITPHKAQQVMDSLTILGPTVLLAMLTGVLLFASSIISGWAENWFVFHNLESALSYHPRLRKLLGAARTRLLAQWLRRNVLGLSANISLGLLLGLVPAVLQFFGVPAEVRHVTLVSGQLAAAAHTLGADVLQLPAFWLALAGVALVGPLNVAVSFLLAFRTAIVAQNVQQLDRRRIYAALRYRLRHMPLTFVFPPRVRKS